MPPVHCLRERATRAGPERDRLRYLRGATVNRYSVHARTAYLAFAKSFSGWVPWEELTERDRDSWRAAVTAAIQEYLDTERTDAVAEEAHHDE